VNTESIGASQKGQESQERRSGSIHTRKCESLDVTTREGRRCGCSLDAISVDREAFCLSI
jgi:hypothetical protein